MNSLKAQQTFHSPATSIKMLLDYNHIFYFKKGEVLTQAILTTVGQCGICYDSYRVFPHKEPRCACLPGIHRLYLSTFVSSSYLLIEFLPNFADTVCWLSLTRPFLVRVAESSCTPLHQFRFCCCCTLIVKGHIHSMRFQCTFVIGSLGTVLNILFYNPLQ